MVTPPVNSTGVRWRDARILCNATSIPAPSYKWYDVSNNVKRKLYIKYLYIHNEKTITALNHRKRKHIIEWKQRSKNIIHLQWWIIYSALFMYFVPDNCSWPTNYSTLTLHWITNRNSEVKFVGDPKVQSIGVVIIIHRHVRNADYFQSQMTTVEISQTCACLV